MPELHQCQCRIRLFLLQLVILAAFALLWHYSTPREAAHPTLVSLWGMESLRARLDAAKIPMILHQTYSGSLVPRQYHAFIADCLRLNPGWQYFLWRDLDADAFIRDHFRHYRQKFLSFPENIQRADMIRYMILYHYGGIYLDMDVQCLKPFLPSLSSAGPAFLDQERREQTQILYGREFAAMNSAMGSVPRHPFFLQMLSAVNSVPSHVRGVLWTTGPLLLTNVYRDWLRSPNQSAHPVTLLQPEVFSPMVDIKSNHFRYICRKLAPDRPLTIEHYKLFKGACKSILSKDWRPDAPSPNATVGRHHFLHLGYHWGPRSAGKVNLTASHPGVVKMYGVDRMRSDA